MDASAPTQPVVADEALEIPLYAKRKAIYQKEIRGPWQDRRAIALVVLAGIYLIGPWLTWGERQALWLNLPARQFNLFGITLWPQDFILLSWLMIIAALGLFFFTNLAGRLWCGYGCPQTVWTKFFMWMEWLTEGDRNQRIMLDRGPWTTEKFARKSAKHGIWVLFSIVVGVTFVGYFVPIREYIPRLLTADLSNTEWVATLFFSGALYFDAGWMREQICLYACPYARFQGAMFDDSTLTIVYDPSRGEPRGSRSRTTDRHAEKIGDCIDCGLCVHVCPTGIDIRDGTQYECIGCAACIDACDEIMDKVGYPKGLVRYATEEGLAGKPTPLLRSRSIGYGLLLTAMMSAFTYVVVSRVPLELDVLRERNQLYRETSSGDIENLYRLRVLNMDQKAHTYAVVAAGVPGLTAISDPVIEVAAGEIADVPVRLRAPAASLHKVSTTIEFTLTSTDDAGWEVSEHSRFLAPATVMTNSGKGGG